MYTDLREIKSILEIDPSNNIEDKRLLWWIEQLSNLIEETVFGRDLSYKVRTRYYDGYGTQRILLKHRPVFPTAAPSFAASLPFTALTVVTDDFGYYGSASGSFATGAGTGQPLTYGSDYCIRLDENLGGVDCSRSAVLIRINEYWNRPQFRQVGLLNPFLGKDTGSIKVTYTAGYTVDTLPATVRMALDQLVAQVRYLFPLGILLASESYEDRAISALNERRDGILALAKSMIHTFRDWHFGG